CVQAAITEPVIVGTPYAGYGIASVTRSVPSASADGFKKPQRNRPRRRRFLECAVAVPINRDSAGALQRGFCIEMKCLLRRNYLRPDSRRSTRRSVCGDMG